MTLYIPTSPTSLIASLEVHEDGTGTVTYHTGSTFPWDAQKVGTSLAALAYGKPIWKPAEPLHLFGVDDLPAAADALEQIAEYDTVGLDWEEPRLAEAQRTLLTARALILEAASLFDDVRKGL